MPTTEQKTFSSGIRIGAVSALGCVGSVERLYKLFKLLNPELPIQTRLYAFGEGRLLTTADT